jgi:methylenetetrahydrofolate reductase (NADPH)
MCKAALPVSFLDKLAESDEADWQFGVGVEFAQNQVRELLDQGVPGMHFYVLNKFQATAAVLDAVEYVS